MYQKYQNQRKKNEETRAEARTHREPVVVCSQPLNCQLQWKQNEYTRAEARTHRGPVVVCAPGPSLSSNTRGSVQKLAAWPPSCKQNENGFAETPSHRVPAMVCL